MNNNDKYYKNMCVSVEEENGLYNLREIIYELKEYHTNFDAHANNEYTLFLQGQQDMLCKIIKYLENVL
jgi:anion-transporting  ArsA/GET3 family ATPase